MNIDEAAAAVQDMLDVTEKRYSTSVAFMHVNQACQFLSNEYDVSFDKSYVDKEIYPVGVDAPVPTPAPGSGRPDPVEIMWRRIHLTSGFIPGTNFNVPIGVKYVLGIWVHPSTDEQSKLQECSFSDIMQYATPSGDEVLGYAIHGDYLYLFPEVEGIYRIRVSFQAKQSSINPGETNGWLTHAPFATVYKAAEFAAIYLLEDERVPMFNAMWKEEVRVVESADGMRGFDEPMIAEEP